MSDSQKYTEAKKRGNRKWDAANLDRLSIAVPKGRKEAIKAHAEAQGESVNGFIGRAIEETMERDKGGPGAAAPPWEGAPPREDLLSPEAIQEARKAAESAGETVPAFLERAVTTQAQRDAFAKALESARVPEAQKEGTP